MAIAFDTSGSGGSTTAGTSTSIDITAAAVGAAVFLCWQGGALEASMTFTGWTQIESADTNTTSHHGIFYRIKQSGDTTFTLSWPTSTKHQWGWVSYTGCDATTPYESFASAVHSTTASTSYATGTGTPTAADRWGVTFYYVRSTTANFAANAAWSAEQISGSAITERLDTTSSGGTNPWSAVGIADSAAAVTQAAHSGTATLSQSEANGGGAILYLIPAAAVAGGPVAAARRIAARTPALPPVRRYRQLLPVPAQLNPPFGFTEIAQRRETWPRGLPRRGHVTFAVAPQVNPPYLFAGIRQQRQPRGLFPRRGRGFAPVPAQQAAPAAPAFVWQPLRHTRLAAAARRGRLVAVPPAQVPAAAPPWTGPHRVPARAAALICRRFRQLLPWPQATVPAVVYGRARARTGTIAAASPHTGTTAAARAGTQTATSASAHTGAGATARAGTGATATAKAGGDT